MNKNTLIAIASFFIIGLIACGQWLYIRKWRREFIPGLGDTEILREIRWSLVFPVLSVAGIVIALAHVPWSVMIYLLAPLIMAYLFWHQTG